MGLPGAGAFLSSFLVGKTPASMAFPEFQRAGSREELVLSSLEEQPRDHLRQDYRDQRSSSRLGDPPPERAPQVALVVKNLPASAGEI